MRDRKAFRANIRNHLHKNVLRRLGLYFGISVIVFGLVVYEIVRSHIGIGLPVLGLVIGAVIGVVFSRMYKFSWDRDAEKVVSRMDVYGIVFMLIYLVFAIFRARLIGHFVHGPALAAVTFAVSAGIMYGRVIGMRGRIMLIFKERDMQ